MNFKPKPIRYNTGEGIVKIRIEDDSGAVIENWTVMMSDLWKWARTMRQKYGIKFEEPTEDKDLDWALK